MSLCKQLIGQAVCPSWENGFLKVTMCCISNRSVLRKKHRAINTKTFLLCPGLCTPCEAAGHSAVGAHLGPGSGIRNVQCWSRKKLAWETRAALGKQPQVCRREFWGLLSVLEVGVDCGLCPIDCRAQRTRSHHWVWSTGFEFWCECVHQGERPQQPTVLNMIVCIGLLLAGCFFMLQEFLFFIHSIPFYMILNSFLAIFLFL